MNEIGQFAAEVLMALCSICGRKTAHGPFAKSTRGVRHKVKKLNGANPSMVPLPSGRDHSQYVVILCQPLFQQIMFR